MKVLAAQGRPALPIQRSRLWLLVLAILALATPALAQQPPSHPLRVEPLTIVTHHGRAHFTVEVANDEGSREYGLMFRKHIAPDRGMLFDFRTVQPVQFWMKNTVIPLDMVFIAADGRVVSVVRNAVPYDETPVPTSGPIAVLGVLEIAGGRAAQLDIEPGDEVRADIFHP
jgi:uncharacterized membrane protein (UPF0127 family)